MVWCGNSMIKVIESESYSFSESLCDSFSPGALTVAGIYHLGMKLVWLSSLAWIARTNQRCSIWRVEQVAFDLSDGLHDRYVTGSHIQMLVEGGERPRVGISLL